MDAVYANGELVFPLPSWKTAWTGSMYVDGKVPVNSSGSVSKAASDFGAGVDFARPTMISGTLTCFATGEPAVSFSGKNMTSSSTRLALIGGQDLESLTVSGYGWIENGMLLIERRASQYNPCSSNVMVSIEITEIEQYY